MGRFAAFTRSLGFSIESLESTLDESLLPMTLVKCSAHHRLLPAMWSLQLLDTGRFPLLIKTSSLLQLRFVLRSTLRDGGNCCIPSLVKADAHLTSCLYSVNDRS